MKLLTIDAQTNEARRDFFTGIFGDNSGYVCISILSRTGKMREHFFAYPINLDEMLEHINQNFSGKSVYFCPQLLGKGKRRKENVMSCPVVWADLDECDPSVLDPAPTFVVQSSPGRHQAYWKLDKPAAPADAEDAAHRIAYKYESYGADKSGWDLTQLLRVPLTYNTKYGTGSKAPVVELVENTGEVFTIETFQELPSVPGLEFEDIPFPEEIMENDPGEILDKHKQNLAPIVLDLFSKKPKEDWSAALWRLENELLEAGVSREETFVVCWHAKCNKYARDNRPPEHLWLDVCKADTRVEAHHDVTKVSLPQLLTHEEREKASKNETFIDRYIEWAKGRSDAAPQYHEATAFVVVSAVLAGVLKMRLNFGTMIPNIWVMILADTTLTRKSTAMDMAMDLIEQVDDNALLATEATTEGLVQALSLRSGRPSIFHKDEFSGLLEGMKRKDYLSGLAEILTNLYDGKNVRRQLRREEVVVRNPILLMLAGGIKSKIYELMDTEYISSGFAPRFIFVTAESDMSRYRPLGLQEEEDDDAYADLVQELSELRELYTSDMVMRIGGQKVEAPAEWNVEITQKALDRYNELEKTMVAFGIDSDVPALYTPMMDRLSKTALKCAMLIAACRQDPMKKGKVIVDVDDILKAITFVEKWRHYTIDIIQNAGKTVSEKRIEAVFRLVHAHRGPVPRSKVMQNLHLTSRDADWIFETLMQRGLIGERKQNRAKAYVSLAKQ